LVENVIWGEGLAENVRISSFGGRGSKIAQKNCPMIFERFLILLHVIKYFSADLN